MRASLFNNTSRWWLPGLIAGMVYLGIAIVSGALTTTAWAMPDAIAQAVGIGAPASYGFAPIPLLVGIAVHLAVSIGLGALFAVIAHWRRLHGWVLVAAAVIFAAIEPAAAIWGALHNLLPARAFHFFLAAVPWWGSVLGHCMYGLTLGLIVAYGPFTATWKSQRPNTQHRTTIVA